MALKLMPGETRNFAFKLPIAVSALNTVNVRFFQNDEKVVEYNNTQSENVYGSASDEFLLFCVLPREDTLKFENKIRAFCQIEWESGGYHSVAKAQRITDGDYYNREYEVVE